MSISRSASLRLVLSLALLGLAAPAHAEQPIFDYETMVPGYFLPRATDVTVDAEGNAYVIGFAYEDQVNLDVLVWKVSPDGEILWTRFIVGESHDLAEDLILDDQNNVWVIGWTDSEDFPTTPDAMNPTLVGVRDVFLTKFSTDDGSILYSTFLGGTYVDEGHAIAYDQQGNLILAGITRSHDFPTTPDAYQDGPTNPGVYQRDIFIARLTPSADEILYSTYFGGYNRDELVGVGVDPNGDIVFGGTTMSVDFPLMNPIQSQPRDIYVSKLSGDGSELLFSTYFGGEDFDRLIDMDLDAEGHVYLTGSTRSEFLPVTPGAFQTEFAGEINGCGSPPFDPLHNCEDGYITKMPTDGGWFIYSTYLGGIRIDECYGIAVDMDGAVRVTGRTSSPDFPGTETEGDLFVSKLSPDGSQLDYTLRRGTNAGGYGVTTVGHNEVYVTGSIDFPAMAYIAKLMEESSASAPDLPASSAGLLAGGSPNPFTSSTRLSYSLPGNEPAEASLGIYDVAGRLVSTLVDGPQPAGSHSVTWDGSDQGGKRVAGGVYYYVLEAAGQKAVGRLLYVR